jgi:hypothetical protein
MLEAQADRHSQKLAEHHMLTDAAAESQGKCIA